MDDPLPYLLQDGLWYIKFWNDEILSVNTDIKNLIVTLAVI